MATKPLVARVALTDQVTSILQERILDRAYAPGERLNIDALSREFSVSSSPIREALTRLSAVGLVTATSFAGFSVTPVPSRHWFEQLRDFRIIAEGAAARELARRRSPEALARMTESLQSMEGETFGTQARDFIPLSRADEIFHEAMLDASGNEILAQSVRGLRPHLHHARLFSRVPQFIEPLIAEHRAILDAIVAGDPDAAGAALEAHLVASWERYDGWRTEEPVSGAA
jgi:DNA-binding GntR family transcriptional regulator